MNANTLNALVAQNETLINLINAAEDAEQLGDAGARLSFVAGLWESLNYGYKVTDLRLRIRDRANGLIRAAEWMVSQLSRCPARKRKWNAEITLLEAFR